jgi:hypothetical protein
MLYIQHVCNAKDLMKEHCHSKHNNLVPRLVIMKVVSVEDSRIFWGIIVENFLVIIVENFLVIIVGEIAPML